MPSRESATRQRRLAAFGDNLRSWRIASKLTADLVATRAGISRDTLRDIERGSGTVRLENVFAVLEALGLDSAIVTATDPMSDSRGRALMQRGLPERVRS